MNYKTNSKKRVAALILSAIMILSISFSAFSMDYDYGYTFIESLGAFPKDVLPEDNITKGEFAYIIARTLFKDIADVYDGSPFVDVSREHKYASEISLLKSLKAINGDSYGNFYPELEITPVQAATMLVNTLGYAQYAEAQGGYPTGYLYVAKLCGITKSLEFSENTLTLTEAAKMVYNSLFANVVVVDKITDDEILYNVEAGVSAMAKYLNIEKVDAVIISDGMTAVTGSVAGDNQVKLKDYSTGEVYTLECENPLVSDYLGMRIDGYVHTDRITGENKLVHFEKKQTVNVTEILSDDIIATRTGSIEYEVDKTSGKTKTVNFSSDGATVMFNGVKTAVYSPSDLKPSSGKVRLVDNNGDNRAEYVFVYEYTGLVIVDRVSTTDEFVGSKLRAMDNIDYSESSNSKFFIMKDGEAISFEALKQNDVINVAKSDKAVDGKSLYYLFVSSESLNGKITSSEPGNMILYVDDVEYKVSAKYKEYKPSLFTMLSANTAITAYIDNDGKIAYIDGGRAEGTYYYIVNLYSETSFEGDVKLRLFTDLAAFSDPVVSKNVRIDGKGLDGKLMNGSSATMFNEIKELLSVRPDGTIDYMTAEKAAAYNKTMTNINPRPAKIKFNAKGEVISIDTDAINTTAAEDNLDKATLKPGRRDLRRSRFNNTLGTPDGSYYITTDTVVLKVPDIDRYGIHSVNKNLYINTYEQELSDINNYKVMRIDQNEFASGGSGYVYFDIQGYDIDPDTGTAGLAIVRGFTEYMGYVNAPLAVFDRMTKVYDEKLQTQTHKIYYYVNGVETSAMIDENRLHPYVRNVLFGGEQITAVSGSGLSEIASETATIKPLQHGDLMGIHVDAEGYVAGAWKDIEIADINSAYSSSNRSVLPAGPYRLGKTDNSAIFQPAKSGTAIDISGSYSMLLGIVKSVSGTAADVMIPCTINATYGTEYGVPLGEIYNDNTLIYNRIWLLENSTRYTLLEETECRSHIDGKCKFRIGEGNINDIKAVDSFATESEGIAGASRLYTYSPYAANAYVIIMNLNPNHDR